MPSTELFWRKLIPGASVVVALVLTALVVLVRVGLGNLPGKKFTIYALTDQARGILGGSDVWLAGQRAGVVAGVEFLPAPPSGRAASAGGVLLKLDILEKYQHLIAHDSYAQVRGGSRLLGNPVLHISLGMLGQLPVRPGDTLVTRAQFDADATMAKAEQAVALFPIVQRDLRRVLAAASGLDSLFALVTTKGDSSGAQSPLSALLSSFEALGLRMQGGSMGLFLHDGALAARIQSVGNSTASLSRQFNIEQSQLGQFVRDTGLISRIDSVASTFTALLAGFQSRFDLKTGARAEALRREIDRLSASLMALRNDTRRHPFRYIIF